MSKLYFFLLFVGPSLTVSVYDGSATDNKENNREDLSPVNVHGYDASSTAYLPPVVIEPRRRPRERGEGRSTAGMVPRRRVSHGYSRVSGAVLDRDPAAAQTSSQLDSILGASRPERMGRSFVSDDRNRPTIENAGDSSAWIREATENIAPRPGRILSERILPERILPERILPERILPERHSPGGECRSDQFQCQNMKCIAKSWVGDGDNDCGDNSDEETGECSSDAFQCRNMKCIPQRRVGDGDNDCGDNSDEERGVVCPSKAFQCRNMKCINKSWVGDGDNDCGDNSDEETGECRSEKFQCRNMKCIDKNRVGDGADDCGDNSDEETDRGRSVDTAVGGSSEHTSSNTGDSSSNDRNRPTTENTGDSSARIRVTTENTEDNSARIRATTENITARRRSRFGWYSAVTRKRRLGRISENIRQTGDDVGSDATLGVTTTYNRAPAPNPSVPLSCPEPNGLFPHPYECSKYLQCDRNSLFTRTCGPGTVFNPLNSVCDWPYNVDCQAVATPPVVVTTPPVVVTPPPRRATTWHGFDLRLNLEG